MIKRLLTTYNIQPGRPASNLVKDPPFKRYADTRVEAYHNICPYYLSVYFMIYLVLFVWPHWRVRHHTYGSSRWVNGPFSRICSFGTFAVKIVSLSYSPLHLYFCRESPAIFIIVVKCKWRCSMPLSLDGFECVEG